MYRKNRILQPTYVRIIIILYNITAEALHALLNYYIA